MFVTVAEMVLAFKSTPVLRYCARGLVQACGVWAFAHPRNVGFGSCFVSQKDTVLTHSSPPLLVDYHINRILSFNDRFQSSEVEGKTMLLDTNSNDGECFACEGRRFLWNMLHVMNFIRIRKQKLYANQFHVMIPIALSILSLC